QAVVRGDCPLRPDPNGVTGMWRAEGNPPSPAKLLAEGGAAAGACFGPPRALPLGPGARGLAWAGGERRVLCAVAPPPRSPAPDAASQRRRQTGRREGRPRKPPNLSPKPSPKPAVLVAIDGNK